MRSVSFALLIFSLLAFAGCTEKEDEENPFTPKVTFQITVLDATKRKPSNPVAMPAADATVSIFLAKEDYAGNNPKYIGKTNSNGIFTTTVTAQSIFYFSAAKGNATITKNGFLIGGIFTSQDEILNFPAQKPVPQVGDLIHVDLNGDGVIDGLDKINYHSMGATTSTTLIKRTIYISE